MSDKINVGGAGSTSCITGSGERSGPDGKRHLDDDGKIMD
jgi:hypothetical protein